MSPGSPLGFPCLLITTPAARLRVQIQASPFHLIRFKIIDCLEDQPL